MCSWMIIRSWNASGPYASQGNTFPLHINISSEFIYLTQLQRSTPLMCQPHECVGLKNCLRSLVKWMLMPHRPVSLIPPIKQEGICAPALLTSFKRKLWRSTSQYYLSFFFLCRKQAHIRKEFGRVDTVKTLIIPSLWLLIRQAI